MSPHLAILGAGPTGLEAALAAHDTGLPFTLFEAADDVAHNVADWGHVRLFTPWSMSVSPRMRARLATAGHVVPDDATSCPRGRDLLDQVYRPVAALPEVAPRLALGTRVVALSRQGLLKHEAIGDPSRGARPFRLLLEDAGGRRRTATAEVVVDCTGTWSHPNALGDGGIPAPGEEELASYIVRRIPDLSVEAPEWAGRRVLLVGAGHSAQTAARDLAELADGEPGPEVLWALRSAASPFVSDPSDPLPARRELTAAARRLAAGTCPAVKPLFGVVVEAVAAAEARGLAVTLRTAEGTPEVVAVDRILALVGSVGDARLYRQLQVHECWATAGPMKLAASLLAGGSGDCLAQASHGVDTLKSPEPGFFILGSKSYGRNNTFLLRVGWEQVEEVMGELATRG